MDQIGDSFYILFKQIIGVWIGQYDFGDVVVVSSDCGFQFVQINCVVVFGVDGNYFVVEQCSGCWIGVVGVFGYQYNLGVVVGCCVGCFDCYYVVEFIMGIGFWVYCDCMCVC